MNPLQNEQKKAAGKCLSLQSSRSPLENQRGSYLTITAITVAVLLGFAGLGVEIGRWYAIQGELGKAIDAAAFAGAKNVNNPNIPGLNIFVDQVAHANFPAGMLGADTPSFSISDDGNGKILVDGSANSFNTFSKAINTSLAKTNVATSGSARLRNAEIALVLDGSGSMSGTPITRLKDAAKAFVENFEDQEAKSKFALITFASGAEKVFNLDHDYVSPLNTAIIALHAEGWTNAEDALAQAGALPWKDQASTPPNEQDKQVVVFFSDGNPTAFRGQFLNRNNTYDAVAAVSSTGHNVSKWLYKSDEKNTNYNIDTANVTGDGIPQGSSVCAALGLDTVKWEIFSDPTFGLDSFGPTSGMDPEECQMSNPDPFGDYANWLVRQMAIDNATALKAQGIEIYTIGLGDVDQAYLETLSSGPNFSYYTSDPNELEGIFQTIANILKLVLTS
jgi:uncharacterized protein YegL